MTIAVDLGRKATNQTNKSKEPYIFVIFQGGLDPVPPLDPPMYETLLTES